MASAGRPWSVSHTTLHEFCGLDAVSFVICVGISPQPSRRALRAILRAAALAAAVDACPLDEVAKACDEAMSQGQGEWIQPPTQ